MSFTTPETIFAKIERASPSPRIIWPAVTVRFLDKRFRAWISVALSASQIALCRMAHVLQRVTFSTYDTQISSLAERCFRPVEEELNESLLWQPANLTYIKGKIKPHL